MAIPNYQAVMLPLLRLAADGAEHNAREVVLALSDEFELSEEERQRYLPSGKSTVMRNRVGWAKTYLAQAGLLESTRRGFFRITERGREVLAESPERIDVAYLERFQEFLDFKDRSRRSQSGRVGPASSPAAGDEHTETPEERLESAFAQLRQELEAEVLAQVKASPPAFFERLVVQLLVRMGYGGSRSDAGQAVGGSGDGGIDGIIKEDRLGLDLIYLQAKRWENTVGRPDVQKFAGALQGHRARKGVMLTTSTFSRDAIDYAENIESSIVLIDGYRLAALMVEHNLGVSVIDTYELKRIDFDFFEAD